MKNQVFTSMRRSWGRANAVSQIIFALFLAGLLPDAKAWTVDAPPEPLGPCSRKTSLVISEIMYNPAARTDGRILEFVELFNSNPWPEDISGYRLSGVISYTFPSNTIIAGRGFLVAARSPADISAVYGLNGALSYGATNYVTNIVAGVTNRTTNFVSLAKPNTLELRTRENLICLSIPFSNESPWPVAADGSGHSLVLGWPSYGEASPKAWTVSDVKGGSPGAAEVFGTEPLRPVVINEVFNNTDGAVARFVELFNRSSEPVNITGAVITDNPASSKYVFAPGSIMAPGGHVIVPEFAIKFKINPQGERVHFVNATGTRVIDVIQHPPMPKGVSIGRYPDGGPELYPLTTPTGGAENTAILVPQIVISEIMYDPISGDSADEYIELYNRGATPVSLKNWELQNGVSFVFPPDAILEPHDYLVVAHDMTHLYNRYSQPLCCTNLVGNYAGKLGNSGDTVSLAMPVVIISTNKSGVVSTNNLTTVVEEVTYGADGRWGRWSHAGGSSIETLDSRENKRRVSNWADSDETLKAGWTSVNSSESLSQGYGLASYLEVTLDGDGECLIDDVKVRGTPMGSGNLVLLLPNTDFESGLAGWQPQGNHQRSAWQKKGGYNDSSCLHIRASGAGDTVANRIIAPLSETLQPGDLVTFQARVRWVRGSTNLLFRLQGGYFEQAARLAAAARPGSPGFSNTRAVSNAPPSIYQVSTAPVLPAANQTVVVSARVEDVDGVGSVTLRYRADPQTNYTTVVMHDDGISGDALANDKIYIATLPGQPDGTLLAFQIQAADQNPIAATNTFPQAAPVQECLIRFGDTNQPSSLFPAYRIWVTQSSIQTWTNRSTLNREPLDATIVYGNKRVIYNAHIAYAADPLHQDFDSPTGRPSLYAITLPGDDLLLGSSVGIKLAAPGDVPGDDDTLQRSLTAQWMAGQLGLPWNSQRPIFCFVNGVRRGALMLDTQTPDADYIAAWRGDKGHLFALNPWFEAGTNGVITNLSWSTLNNYPLVDGSKSPASYRQNWRPVSTEDPAGAFASLFKLINDAHAATNEEYSAIMEQQIDADEWLRMIAFEHAIGNLASFGNLNSWNNYAYKPLTNRWLLLSGEYNQVLGNAGSSGPVGDDLFQTDTNDVAMTSLVRDMGFRRAYLRTLKELADGPMRSDRVNPLVDARYAAFQAAGLTATSPAAMKSWISTRRNYLLSQLSGYSTNFSVSGPALYTTNANWVILSGTAPIDLQSICINGIVYPIHWDGMTNWSINVFLNRGTNHLVVQGYDRLGTALPSSSAVVDILYTLEPQGPIGNVIINEIMYFQPTTESIYVEIYNRSPLFSFDLSGWHLDGASFTFPPDSILGPLSYLVVVSDRASFISQYGDAYQIAGEFAGSLSHNGEVLALRMPGATPSQDIFVNKVLYDAKRPWPTAAFGTGASLQVIDPNQDNSRASNWRAILPTDPDPKPEIATPGRTNSVLASLPPYPSLWINEIQPDNVTGITNSAGGRGPWIELYNSGSSPISLTNYFLSDVLDTLTLWPFPEGSVIPPHRFMIVWLDGRTNLSTLNELHTSFAIGNTNGIVALSRPILVPDPSLTQAFLSETQIVDYIKFKDVPPDMSFGSFPDGQTTDRGMLLFTPGRANTQPLSLYINEWMASNTRIIADPTDNNFQDWFEIYNDSYLYVDLSGFYMTDALTNKNLWRVPDGTVIGPRGYLIVWADGEPEQNVAGQNDLHANFKLSRGGGEIGVYTPSLALVDSVRFGPQADDISEGRYPDGVANIVAMTTPTPGYGNFVPLPSTNLTFMYAVPGGSLSNRFQIPGVPPNAAGFTLGPGAAPGATIDPITGDLIWNIPADQAPGFYPFEIIECDIRPGGETYSIIFTVIIEPKYEIAGVTQLGKGSMTFNWPTLTGLTYRIQFLGDINQTNWQTIGGNIISTGSLQWAILPTTNITQGYFRVMRP